MTANKLKLNNDIKKAVIKEFKCVKNSDPLKYLSKSFNRHSHILVTNEDESEYPDEADVFEKPLAITKESFIKTINQPETGTFVMFHAPWW